MSASKKLATTLANASQGETNPNAWDISYAYYDAQSAAWNLDSLVFMNMDTGISTWDTNPTDVWFKPDGSAMYLLGDAGDDINQFSVSRPFAVWYISYVRNYSFSGTFESYPEGIFFDDTGTKLYMCGQGGDKVYQYSLSTAWDISTLSLTQSFSVGSQETNASDVHFKPDGTKMYVVGLGSDNVYEYDLSTAWDISTASYSQAFSIASQDGVPYGLFFKTDGTKMYTIGATNDSLYEYDLSTAWDVSTASYSTSFSLSDTNPEGFYIDPHGGMLIYIGSGSDKIYQYRFSVGSITSQEGSPKGLAFNSDGSKCYVLGSDSDAVNEYNLSTDWDVNTISYSQNFSIISQDTNAQGVCFSADGTKMYVIGISGISVYQYNLSTAWDVSTASYSQSFGVSSQDIYPVDLFFKADGTKMYVIGNQNDSVYEYALSTAWDISTASYNSASLSVSSYETSPYGLTFSPDGTKMYITGSFSDDIHQYTLSTAWDISTANYDIDFNTFEGNPMAIAWKPDGTTFYIVGLNLDTILAYSISAE